MFSGSPKCLQSNVRKPFQSSTVIPLYRRFQFLRVRPFATKEQLKSNVFPAHASLKSNRSLINRTTSQTPESSRDNLGELSKYCDVSQQPSQNPSEAPATFVQIEDETTRQQNIQAIIDRRRTRQGLVEQKLCLNGRKQRIYYPAQGSTSYRGRQGRLSKKWPTSTKDSRWETALSMLVNLVPQCKEAESEEMWLSKSTLMASSGTSAANSWVHQIRGGCEVQVTDNQSSSGNARQVLLRGTPRAMALTKEHFVSLDKTVMRQQEKQSESLGTALHGETSLRLDLAICKSNADFQAKSGSNLVGSFRFVLAKERSRLKHDNFRLAKGLPSQNANSLLSFLYCVEDLTTMRLPRLERREIYGPRDDRHNKTVAEMLLQLFSDTITAPFASSLALDHAMAFLCRHDELYAQTRSLYIQYRGSRLTILPTTYSHFLRATLLHKDMTNFRHVLDDLNAEGHEPDFKVWLALLKSESSLKQKNAISDGMARRNMLGNGMVKGLVAAEILNAELRQLDDFTENADQLVAAIDARFGQDWLTGPSVAQVLLACAHLKAWAFAVEIFKKAQERNVVFDATIIPVILIVMQRRGSLRDSLHFLDSHFVKSIGRNDQALIPIIFLTAWKHRFYNVCRVLWRYAAVRGIITYKMQNRVTASLLRNQEISISFATSKSSTSATKEWWRRAGKVIVGTYLNTKGFNRFFNLIELGGSKSANPMVWLAQYTQDGEPRDQQLSLAYVMMHRDLEAWKHFATPSSHRLFKLLSEAYAMDIEWKGEGIGLDRGRRSTQWMIENAIDVPLIKRKISLRPRSAHLNLQTTVGEDYGPPYRN